MQKPRKSKSYTPNTSRNEIISERVRSSIDADILQDKAMSCIKQGCFEEAENLLLQALQVREEALGNEHRKLVPVLNNLGLNYGQQLKTVEAEATFERALKIMELHPKQDQFREMEVLENFARVMRRCGQDAKAAAVEQQLEQIKSKYMRVPGLLNVARHVTPSITLSALKVAQVEPKGRKKNWPTLVLIIVLFCILVALLFLWLQ